VPVSVDPDQLYAVETDGAGTAPVAADVGAGRDPVIGTPDTTYKQSGMKLDADGSVNDTFILIDKLDEPKNDWGQSPMKVLVKINKHQFFGKDAATEI